MTTTGVTGGDKLRAYLRGVADRLRSAREVSVGFFEDATYPDGTPVAMVAAINNYGSMASNAGDLAAAAFQGGSMAEGTVRRVPPRPFFTVMAVNGQSHWGDDLRKILVASDMDARVALGRMGKSMENELRDSILSGPWAPNAPSTVARKGFDKPLVDTSQMVRAVDSEVT